MRGTRWHFLQTASSWLRSLGKSGPWTTTFVSGGCPVLEKVSEIRFESEPGSLAFSADGKHLITGLWDGQVAVLDFATRQRLPTPKEHTAWVTVIAVGPDAKSFATASGDRTINLWDAPRSNISHGCAGT